MQELIKLGKITAPVGIKGEFRVYPYTDDKTRFSDIKKLVLAGKDYEVERATYRNNDMVVLKLKGIDDRNTSETLRGLELFLRKEDLWEVPEDTYFVEDILGIRVLDEEGKEIGILKDIIQNPAHDLYEIETPEGKSFLVPAVKEFVRRVDVDAKLMVLHLIEGMGI